MDCPLSWIYSLAQRWTGFQVWRIYAWGGGFSQLSTALVSLPCHLKFHTAPHKAFRLDSTVALRVFIRRHGKLKQTLRSAPIYERPWWQCIATKRVDRSEMCIWVRNCVLFYFFLFFSHCSRILQRGASTKAEFRVWHCVTLPDEIETAESYSCPKHISIVKHHNVYIDKFRHFRWYFPENHDVTSGTTVRIMYVSSK